MHSEQEKEYLSRPQTGWDHCKVYMVQSFAGSRRAGNLEAKGEESQQRRVKKKSYRPAGATWGLSVPFFKQRSF